MNYVTADFIEIDGGAVVQNICSGTSPTLDFVSVGAEEAPDGINDFNDGADYPNGAAITYQWQKSEDNLNWIDIAGATARTYTPTPTLFQTTYFRRLSTSTLNDVACEEVSDNIITINVAAEMDGGIVERNIDPVLDTWEDSTQTLCIDTTPQRLRVVSSTIDPGVDYQWQISKDNTNWEDIALNATGAEYQPLAIQNSEISSVSSFTITIAALAPGDFYRVTIGADIFNVTIGEVYDAAEVGFGASPVDNIDEVLALMEYKINDSGSGITAVDNAATDNILITLAPGSVLSPVYLINDLATTAANSVNALTYDGEGNTRYFRRKMTQNFGGAVLPNCETYSDVHTVEINSVIAGKVSTTDLVICHNTQPSEFISERDGYSTNIGSNITYQWYNTTDQAMSVWNPIAGAINLNLNYGIALTQSTSFKRRTISEYNGEICFSESDPIQITVLDEVEGGFILAEQNICREQGAPLTVDVNDLFDIIVNAVETDDGDGDGINYQWQFSVDNLNWDDIIIGDRADLLDGGFTQTLSQTTQITTAQLDSDIEKRLRSIVDPDVSTSIYYRLHTTRYNDQNNNDILDAGELECDEAFSAVTTVTINAQPTLVQTTAPADEQTVCVGDPIDPITFRWGGSATGIRLVNLPNGINPIADVVTDGAAKTVTISGTPNSTGFIRVETEGTTCETIRIQHLIRVTTAPQIPDYILIDDAVGGLDPIPIIEDQDGNIYNGQIYLCEQALSTSPSPTTFSACYNDGRVAPLTESYIWYISPPNAGIISATTGYVTWDDGFIGDATISVVAIGCDGTATATLTTEVTVNEFDSSASNPTEPIPLLEAQRERVTISGLPVVGEVYNITLNGVKYSYEITVGGTTAAQVATELSSLIDNDLTSPISGLFDSGSAAFNQGDLNDNGLNDEAGGLITITAQYDGDSSPAIPPATPRGYGGDFRIQTSVTPSPDEARAFGFMTSRQINETSTEICGELTGSEPICETTINTPNTQYFSTASFYSSIRYAVDLGSIAPGVGSVASPGGIVSSTGIFDWDPGFHGTFNIESYATGCDGVENPIPGVHTVRIYPNLDPPSDISYDPLTLPDCPAIDGETTQFTSSSEVTWSWNNNEAGTLDSVTGLVTWAEGWSGTVIITATSFGCGGESLSRTVIVPDSPSLSRISDPTTTNQSLCVGSNIVPIRYEILGSATGANVSGIDDLNLFITPSSENQVDNFIIDAAFPDVGDQYILIINQVPYTVTIGEDSSDIGTVTVTTLDDISKLFVFKINAASLGITAVNNAPGDFTLTSNAFDFSVNPTLNDIDDDDDVSFTRNTLQNGGTFIEISGTISTTIPVTAQTTYQYTITTVGGTCTPTTAQGFISISPNSNMTIQPGMDLGQTICNNSVGVFDPIIYNLDNALTVNVNWTPNRPTGISHTHLFRNQISTIELGGNDANVAANNGESYTITINSTTVTYTVDTGAPQNDNSKADILNGLRTEILSANLPVSVNVVGSSLNITSVNAKDFTLSGAGGNAPLQFGVSNTSQTATNTLSIFGDPTVAGLAVDTTYGFTVSTVNNAFGCNDPAVQVSSTGSVTITPEPSIALTLGSDNLIICQGETVSSTQGGIDIEWDITGYALGASIGAGQLPNGVLSSYTEIPQITEINFGGDPATFDDTDEYSITVNGIINTVTVSAADGLNSFDAILQRFETLIDSNVALVNATFAAGVLTIQSNSGDATVVAVGINDVDGDADQPALNAPNITQTNRKFLRIFGAPTDPAGIYNYTISTFGTNCDPATANGIIRVVETPTISVSAGSDANPSGLCNGSPMNPISFDISTFSTYTVSWTGANGQPPGISLIRTTSSTLSLVSDPVINIPGAIPAGGVSYTYRIYSTVNDNGCSTEASIEGIVNITNGTATLDLDDASSLIDDRVDADGGGFDPSIAPDYVLIESCQGSEIDDVIFISSVDVTNVAIASGNLPSGLFTDFTPNARAGGIGELRIYGTPDNTALTQDLVLEAITDACVPAADIRVRIQVFQNSSIDLDPGSDDNQIVCNNAALPANISYTIEGALDATVTGLPNGLVGNFQAPNKFVISGDLDVAGLTTTTIYTYTVSTTNNPGGALVGPCSETSITGNITVRPEESLSVNPLPDGSVTQQVCYGEDITPIVINVVGDNTYASLANPLAFPDGMNFDFVEDADNMGGILTISGSPSNAIVGNDPFTYSFTVTTDGAVTSPCVGDTQLIEITVVPPSDLVFAGADPAILNQTVCEGTLISDIEFRIAGGASDIVATFDPGLGFNRATNIRLNDPTDVQNSIIYGNAPDVVNTEVFNFEITTVNQCNPGNDEVSLFGTITVIPEETIEHRPATGDLVQEACVNSVIDPIIFDVTGQDAYAEFTNPNSVPSGIVLDFAPNQINGNGGVATILGSPDSSNAPGDYTFEITTGGLNTSQCIDDTQSITITVNALPTMVFSGADSADMNQSVCQETPITPIEFTLGGGANDVIFSSSPVGLGFTRANNVSVDGNSVQIFGTAPAVVAETTFTYSLSTVSPNSCTPSVTLGGTITVYPPVQYNNWLGNLTVNDPLCSDDGGSIEVNPAAVSGGFVAVKQQSSIELNNLFEVGDIITINIGPQTFNYTVQGVDNATGNLSNDPFVFDRAQSKSEIITEIVGLINDSNSGSTLVTAVGNSPAVGIATLIAKTSGIGFTLTSSKQPLASPGVITLATPIPNQSLTYGYYWRQTNSIGTPVSTLDISDPTTYVGTGLTLNLNSVTGSEYYLLTTVSNNCQADSPFVTITAPEPLALRIDSICDTEIVADGSGGTGQLTYIIYNSNGTEIGRSPATFGAYTFSDGDANNLPGGGFINITPGFQYQIGIVDENNCSLNGNDSTVQVNTPLALEIDETRFDLTPAGCSNDDGSIVMNGAAITGGSAGNTGDYLNITFQWNRIGGGYSNNSQNIYDLAPGDYVLTITDNLCPTLTATSDIFTIIDNGTFEIINAPDNTLISNCSDGHLQISIDPANPGSGNFSFEWTDQFGVTRGNTNRIEDLDAGIYTLVVRDTTTNCQRTYTYTITGSSGPLSMINPVAVNQANFSTTDILCNGAANGTFTVEFTGGNPPYSYSLNGAAFVADGFTTSTSSVSTGGASSTVVSYTTQILTLDGLEGGTYSVKIKDSGLCTDDSGNVIELNLGSVTINEPDPLTIELNASTTEAIDCTSGIQGSLGVNITGGTVSGTTPYSILWELYGPNGEVLYKRTTSGSPSDPDDLIITDLDYAGDYTVTVTDANGCSTSEIITLDDGSNEDPFNVGETPIITQPGCNSEELGSIELEMNGGVQPYNIKWYKLSVAQENATSSTSSGTGTSTSTTSSSTTTIEFSDGGYVSMNKDGFYLIDNLAPGKYRAIVTDATGCQIFSRAGVIKTSSFNMVNQRVYNREVLDCDSGLVESDFSFRLTGTSLAYNIYLDGNLVYGGTSATSSLTSSSFTNDIVKQGNTFVIRGLNEGRHIVEVQDAANPECSLDYAFDIETYVPITFEGETEFEFDICDSTYEFELDTNSIIGGNPIIDDNDNAIYNLRWTYTPLDPNEPGSSFRGRTSFDAGRGTYELVISDGVCESEVIEFVFSGDIDVLSIDGLLTNGEISQGVSCELGAKDGRISIDITGGSEPYDISWEIFDPNNPIPTPANPASPTNSPWLPLDGTYPGLQNFDGFTTLNDLPAGLYRYTIRSGSTCPNSIDTPFNYFRDVISVDDDNTLVLTEGPYVDSKLCAGQPGLLILDAVNNSDSNAPLNFFYINTNGTDDILDDGAPVALNGNTTKLDEDTYQILIDTPFEYGKIVITTDEGCGVESEINLALGDPYFSYTSTSLEQVNEIPARENVIFTDESEGEFSMLEWDFGDNSETILVNTSGTASGVTQVTHAYGNSGTYYPTLTIFNELGCYERVTNPILIGRGYSIYLPNVFTPNNDCLNDFFRPLFTGFESLTFSVYDYNGNLIYTEEAQDGSIDRSQCPDVIDSSGNGKAILGWDGKRSDGSIIDSFSPIFTYSIRGIPLNRANDEQVIIRSGIFTLLK
ncbi:MAG: PKD domain-containing protein [Flavobacteriaceae bacterium]